MNEALKQDVIEREIVKYKNYQPQNNYIFASIFPAVDHMFLFKREEEFKSGNSKHFIVVFEHQEILFYPINRLGNFDEYSSPIIISQDDVTDIKFKKRLLISSLTIITKDKKIKLKFSTNAVGLKWQKGNATQLIENNWRI